MDSSAEPAAGDTDADLLRLCREGDRRAFSELWRRHAPTAVAYARSLGAAPPDPEDVVSDAFLSILQLLRTGRGPEERFRPYLLTTVRNTWMTAARRAPTTVPIDDVEPPRSVVGEIDLDSMVDSAALAEAFCALPERWQQALWLSEVEQLPPREIARVLGLRANAVAALTYRARDGLRKAWISAHLRRAPAGSDHARVIQMLGAFVQDDLGPRPQKFVADHLSSCGGCSAAAGEARHLARAITLGPLLVGGAGLVISPAFFPAASAAAAAGSAAVLWPVAAAVAVALSVGGSLFARTPTEPDATAVVSPAVTSPSSALPSFALPSPAASEPAQAAETLPEPKIPAVPATPAPGPGTERSFVPDAPVDTPDVAPAPAPPASEEQTSGGDDTDASTDDETTAPPAYLTRTAPATWHLDVSVTQDTTAPDCIPVARVSITGTPGATLAIIIDGLVAGKHAELDGAGRWSGDVVLPSTRGQHTLSLHFVDESGTVGEVAVQTEIEY